LYFEDYLQEGRLVLHKAIKCYDMNGVKTFNKYFDLILTNRFISILRKNKKEIDDGYTISLAMSVDNISYNKKLEDIDFSKLHFSFLEKEVYKYRFLRNLKVIDICQMLNVTEKTVYNSIQRIKKKLNEIKIDEK
jgi:RNA polymerase sporulation-specific sigma factor